MTDTQQVMTKFTRAALQQLYGVDCHVFFREMYGFCAIFRVANLPPYSVRDRTTWEKKPLCSITFSEKLFDNKEFNPRTWQIIVHEVTHFKVNISSYSTRRLYHSLEFKKVERKNCLKLKALRKEFYREVRQ